MQYATLTEANAYFATRLHTDAWDAASDSNRNKALIEATRAIDLLNYNGDKTDSEQETEFPRGGDEVVPTDIQIASYEIAYALLDGVDMELEYRDLGAISEGYSSVRSTYDRTLAQEHIAAGIPSAAAWRRLKPYLRDGLSFKLSRVN